MAVLRVVGCVALLLVAGFLLAAPVAAQDEQLVSHGPASRGASSPVSDPAADLMSWVNHIESDYEKSIAEERVFGIQAAKQTKVVPKGRTIVVNNWGKGDYKSIQKAIDSIPKGNKKRITIIIKNGVYREKIRITKDKPYITFQCSGRKTILVWADTAEKAGGTSLSASTAVESEGFIATDCTFANSAPAPAGGSIGKQAVALRIQGDKGAFYRCFFYGAQDTLYDKYGRHYFRNCHIQGSIDFIMGDGQSLYHQCMIKSIAKRNSGAITAQKRLSKNSKSGFAFLGCKIGGSGSIYLGRAWGSHSRVVYIRCHMAKMILPVGWQDWADPMRQKTVFYAEYMCSGPGANRRGRAPWSKLLTAKQAEAFSSIRYIDGQRWLGK